MERIDKYINSIYRGMDNSSEEVEDLKQEMKIHLMETVKELQENGVNEEESIRIAIERFGGEFQIRSELNQVLRLQKLFAKKILIVSIILLVMSAILFITSIFLHQASNKRFHIMDSQLNALESKLKSDGITGVDTYLKALFVSDNNQLTYVAVKELPKDFDISKSNELFPGEIKYSYPEKIRNEYFSNSFGHEVDVNGSRYFLQTGVKTSANTDSSSFYSGLATLIFAVCWVLLIIWSIINVHGYGCLKPKWSILICLTGILGYFIFSLSVNPKNDVNNKRKNIMYISVFCLVAASLIVHWVLNNPFEVQRLLDIW